MLLKETMVVKLCDYAAVRTRLLLYLRVILPSCSCCPERGQPSCSVVVGFLLIERGQWSASKRTLRYVLSTD